MDNLHRILTDKRLLRLSTNGRKFSLQMWILKVKVPSNIKDRLLYGRIMPHNFSDNTWHSSNTDTYQNVGDSKFQLLKVTLYCDSNLLTGLLEMLYQNKSILEISKIFSLKLAKKDENRFGCFSLGTNLAIKPVSHLAAGHYMDNHCLKSPLESASAFSASIYDLHRETIFELDSKNQKKLIQELAATIRKELGLDILGDDSHRIANLEMLVFPALDDSARNLLYLEFYKNDKIIEISIKKELYTNLGKPYVKIELCSGKLSMHSLILDDITENENGSATFKLPINEHQCELVNVIRMEIYARDLTDKVYSLACQYSVRYFQGMGINVNLTSSGVPARIHNPWLIRKHTNLKRRVDVFALETSSANIESPMHKEIPGSTEPLGDFDFQKYLDAYKPKKLEGGFFSKYKDDEGSGRIDFAMWLSSEIESIKNSIVLIFDPHFESAGISLIAPKSNPCCVYKIITTRKRITEMASSSDVERVSNIMSTCDAYRLLLTGKDLKIYALPMKNRNDAPFHDRYIFVFDKNMNPVKGFQLSNSIQSANENFPMLVTPIPEDFILDAIDYGDNIIADSSKFYDQYSCPYPDDPCLIYDSSNILNERKNRVTYDKFSFFDSINAGTILCKWLNKSTLEGLYGNELVVKLTDLGFISNNSLSFDIFSEVENLSEVLRTISQDDFNSYWDVIGQVLAHLPGGSNKTFLDSNGSISDKLFYYLKTGSNDFVKGDVNESPSDLLLGSLDEVLSRFRTHCDLYGCRLISLDWPALYAVKKLWSMDPEKSLELLTDAFNQLSDSPNKRYFSVLIWQFLEEMSIEIEFSTGTITANLLLSQSDSIPRFLGFCLAESNLHKKPSEELLDSYLGAMTAKDANTFLGWAIRRSKWTASSDKIGPLFGILTNRLIRNSSPNISLTELTCIVDAIKGRNGKIGACEPWLYSGVIKPLIDSECLHPGIACELWMNELVSIISAASKYNSFYFGHDEIQL